MSKIYKIQSNFSSGELSPRLLARVDLDQYSSGCKTMLNAYPLAHGGAKRRQGSVYVGEVFDSTEPAKFIPFVFSKDISYIAVINGGRIEFIKDGAFILNAGPRYYISSPYTASELTDIRFTQLGIDVYITHPNHPPKILTATGDTAWTLTDVPFIYNAITDYWYENSDVEFKIIGGTTTFAVGDTFSWLNPSTTAIAGGSNVGNGIVFGIEYSSLAIAETWTLTCTYADENRQEWSVSGSTSGTKIAKWTTTNYPTAVGSFDQRLWFGGTALEPQTIWGSVIGNPINLTLGSLSSDGVQFTAASNRYDKINHLASGRYLLPLTYGSEFSLVGGADGITPSSVNLTQHTAHGSNDIAPVRIGQEFIFFTRGGSKARAISYSFAEDVNVAPDITLLADHISNSPEEGFVDACFAADPDYVAWVVRSDGVMASATHLRDNGTTGWARHTTDGLYESVISVPHGSVDDVYQVVLRSVDGTARRYVEYFDYTRVINSDSSLDLSGTDQTVWTGLDHLEGEVVDIVADGNVHPQRTVTSGSITLEYPADSIQVGLHYATTIELQHPQLSLNDGTTQGRMISINEIILRLEDTIGVTVNGTAQAFRIFGDTFDTSVEPYTGDIRVHSLGWSADETVTIEQLVPRPFTLLGVVLVINA